MPQVIPSENILSEENEKSWRESGYAILTGVFDTAAAAAALAEVFPPGDAAPVEDFGSGDRLLFPGPSDALNALTTDERLIRVSQRLLADNDLLLTQSVAWAKYGVRDRSEADGGRPDPKPSSDSSKSSSHESTNAKSNAESSRAETTNAKSNAEFSKAEAGSGAGEEKEEEVGKDSNRDQRMHMDYGNNTWVHPPPWERPDTVAAIIYLTDCAETGGGTAVCPRLGDADPLYQRPYRSLPGIGGIPFKCDRTTAEALMRDVDPEGARLREEMYAREIVTRPAAGDVLLYRHDVWHRGTPLVEGTVRYVVNLAWSKRRSVESGGVMRWNDSWIKNMYGTFEPLLVEKFIGRLTPLQLVVLGFPHPKSDLWKDKDARDGVIMRYGWAGFDLDRYLAADL